MTSLKRHFLKNFATDFSEILFQTDAKRRRREAGAIQWIEKGSGHVYMFVYLYICMYVFRDISQLTPLSEVNVAPEESFLLNTLLWRGDLLARCLTNAWRVILGPIG